MRLVFRGVVLSALMLSCAISIAQTQPPAATHKPAPWTRYCQPDGGFCFKYPASWTMMGEVYNGNGVVVAPPQRQERELWNEITVAMVIPPPEGDDEAIGLDAVIQQATNGLHVKGQSFESLQRQQRRVDDKPAEMLKARYHDKQDGHDWIEELVFIEGPDSEIYSVALKCSPQQLARLEPVLAGVLESWTLPEPEPPTDAVEENTPESPTPAPH